MKINLQIIPINEHLQVLCLCILSGKNSCDVTDFLQSTFCSPPCKEWDFPFLRCNILITLMLACIMRSVRSFAAHYAWSLGPASDVIPVRWDSLGCLGLLNCFLTGKIAGLVHNCNISIANALEILQSWLSNPCDAVDNSMNQSFSRHGNDVIWIFQFRHQIG